MGYKKPNKVQKRKALPVTESGVKKRLRLLDEEGEEGNTAKAESLPILMKIICWNC